MSDDENEPNIKVCSKKDMEGIDPNLIYKPKEEIVDLNEVTNQIIQILEFMNTEEMIKMKETDKEIFEKYIDDKFSDFSLWYPSILKLMFENTEENMKKLLNLIDALHKVQNKEMNMDDVYNSFLNNLHEEYFYKPVGGKDNFEKEILKKHQKKLKKQSTKN
jgi:hypothetical protein